MFGGWEMRFVLLLLFGIGLAMPIPCTAQDTGPTDPKAQKTYSEALKDLRLHRELQAFEGFKKANKQDGGHCFLCANYVIELAPRFDDFKAAYGAAQQLIEQAKTPQEVADAHNQRGMVLLLEGRTKKKNDLFAESDREFSVALAGDPKNKQALYFDGMALAYQQHDDAAKARFQEFLALPAISSIDRARALRFVQRPELARARMVPQFAVT